MVLDSGKSKQSAAVRIAAKEVQVVELVWTYSSTATASPQLLAHLEA